MLMVGLIEWWYSRGWRIFIGKLVDQLRNAADFFSIRLLVGNMFSPFRQISVGESTSPALSAQISAFFDRLLSRLIGATVRLILLLAGTLVIILQALVGVLVVVLWPFVPVLIIICVSLALFQVHF